jgi:hypothetical protein
MMKWVRQGKIKKLNRWTNRYGHDKIAKLIWESV